MLRRLDSARVRGALMRLAAALLLLLLVTVAPSPWSLPADASSSPIYRGVVAGAPVTSPFGSASMRVRLLEGPDAGREISATVDLGDEISGEFVYRIDEEVLLIDAPTGEGEAGYIVADRSRGGAIIAILLFFAGAVALFGGWTGIRALLSLGVVLTLLFRFGIPAILSGAPPLLAAGGIAIAVTATTSLITEGATRRATAAIVGIGASLALVCACSLLFDALLAFTPFAGDMDILNLVPLLGGAIDLRGIGLAATLIGTLGIIDDVALTQIAAVAELRKANRRSEMAAVAFGAYEVGRAHIGAVVNTLPLAYLAASLPLVVSVAVAPGGIAARFGTEQVAVELIRSIVGTLGVLAAVPLTTAAAVLIGVGEED